MARKRRINITEEIFFNMVEDKKTMTLLEIGAKYNMSKSYAQKILKRGIDFVKDGLISVKAERSSSYLESIGEICSSCGIGYVKPHGYPVICDSCRDFLNPNNELQKLPSATIPEL